MRTRRPQLPLALAAAVLALLFAAVPARAAVTSAPTSAIESNVVNGVLGLQTAPAGDVNGDGFSDVVAIGHAASGLPQLWLFLGGPAGLTLAPGFPFTMNQPGTPVPNAAGDVNGDGRADVVVGFSNGGSGGRIVVYAGTATGLDTSSPFVFTSTAHGFGAAVGTAGDVNGDGYDDVIVGAPDADAAAGSPCSGGIGFGTVGEVHVFYGSASGLSAANQWQLFGCQWVHTGGHLGAAVATAGDVNADGYDDIVIGAPFDDSSGPVRGAIWIVRGSASGLPVGANGFGTLTGAAKRQPATDQTAFGQAAITAGDVNGDGYADVAVGAPGDDTFGTDAGKVWVFLGPSQVGTPWTIGGPGAGALFGATLTPAGDVNGDGLADLLVGEATKVNLAQSTGTTLVLSTVTALAANQRSLAPAGDVDGDGLSDVAIGDLAWSNGQANEGRVEIFGGRGDGPELVSSWSITTALTNPNLGWSVASAGDVNGDGYDDVLIGEPSWNDDAHGGTGNGQVQLYFGTIDGLTTSPGWIGYGASGDGLGLAVSAAGDLDGDGFGDFIVGATGGASGRGEAMIWYGRATVPDATANVTLTGTSNGSQFGSAVTWGDLNGDGYTDVVVGAPTDDLTGTALGSSPEAGCAYAYLGGPAGLSSSPAWYGSTLQTGAHFGSSVAASGDLDGDGRTDLVVGAPTFDNLFGVDAGRVSVFRGKASGSPLVPIQIVEGLFAGGWFGFTVAHAGDVNGDGRADAIIGGPFTSNTLSSQGRAYVYAGCDSGLAGPLWTQDGTEANGAFAYSVSTAGDVNGDGFSDVLVGGDFEEGGGVFDRGTARVYLGPLPAGAPAAWTAYGPGSAANLGHTVACAGDVNSDGWPDLVFGEPGYSNAFFRQGRAELFLGGRHLGRLAYSVAERLNGAIVHPLGFTDPTRMQLFHFARSAAGRTHVRMEWKLTPVVGLAAPELSGRQGTFTLTGPPGFVGSSAFLSASVSGLTAGVPYAWRTRDLSRSVYFPTSLWMEPARNGAREADLRAPGTLLAVGGGPARDGDLQIAAPRPNPARGSCALSFVLPAAGHARLDVIDLQGRRVRRIVDRALPAGPSAGRWDGRDEGGAPAPAGVYFVRLAAGEKVASRRIVLVR